MGMTRRARLVAVGIPHHITQRGNQKRAIFYEDADRILYSSLIRERAEKFGMEIHAYCLMTNHVHFVAVPLEELSFQRVFHAVNSIFSRIMNRKLESCGHFWQERFYSAPLDDAYFRAAVRYVERNPVRAGMVCRATEYHWSSARAHVTGSRDSLLRDAAVWRDWNLRLGEQEDAFSETLRARTLGNVPCGDHEFIARIECMSGRSLIALPRGRPKKVPVTVL